MYSLYIQRVYYLCDKVNSRSFRTLLVITSFYYRVNISMDLVVNEQFYHPMVEKFVYQPEAKWKTV